MDFLHAGVVEREQGDSWALKFETEARPSGRGLEIEATYEYINVQSYNTNGFGKIGISTRLMRLQPTAPDYFGVPREGNGPEGPRDDHEGCIEQNLHCYTRVMRQACKYDFVPLLPIRR
jgi:hypothetical protein